MRKILFILGFLLVAGNAQAVEYHCVATRAIDWSGEWSKEKIKKWTPSIIVKHYPRASKLPSTISRCSYSQIEGKITCNTYPIDHYETSSVANELMFIDKFYYYRGQMDVQIFLNDGGEASDYIENNGRGTVYRGKCIQP